MHFLPNLPALSVDGVQCNRSEVLTPMFVYVCACVVCLFTHPLSGQSRCRTGSWWHPGHQTSQWQNLTLCINVRWWTSSPVTHKNTQILECMHKQTSLEVILTSSFLSLTKFYLFYVCTTWKCSKECLTAREINVDTARVYLGGSCRNQPYCSHVCTANGLDFLNIPVALFVHQLEGKKEEKKDENRRKALELQIWNWCKLSV